MGYRRFSDKTTFSEAIDATIFTAEACAACPDPELCGLAKPLDKLLDQETGLLAQSRTAGRAVIRANARVRVADGIADDEMGEFVKDLLAAVRQDRKAPLFVAFFPDASPSEVIAMTLAPEATEIERMAGELAKASTPEPLRRAWTKRFAAVLKRGKGALGDRKDAAHVQTEASLALKRWIELADRARRAVDGSITSYAAEKGLAPDLNDRFFPGSPTARKTAKAKKPGGEEGGQPA